jgi:hypothetical protein
LAEDEELALQIMNQNLYCSWNIQIFAPLIDVYLW